MPPKNTVKNENMSHTLGLLLKSKTIWILGLCTMLYIGFAISVAMWIPSYFMEKGANSFLAASIVSLLWVGIIAGRFTYSALSLRFSLRKLIFVSNLIGGVIIICATMVNTIESLAIGYVASGFFSGAVVPLSVAIASKIFPAASGRISSIIILFVSFGMIVIPGMIGIIAENTSFYSAILVLNLCPVLIAVSSFFLKENNEKKG